MVNQKVFTFTKIVLQCPMGFLIIEGSLCIQNNPIKGKKIFGYLSNTFFA